MTILSKIFSPARSLPRSSHRKSPTASVETQHATSHVASSKPKTQNIMLGFLGGFANAIESLQKYQDIPLRFHRQWLTNFLGILLLVGVISGIYLNVTSRTAIAGREIQKLEAKIIVNQQKNADLETAIAGTLSDISLEERAAQAGFVLVTRDDIKYLSVPGYVPPQRSAPFVGAPSISAQGLPAEYSETLLTWLARQLELASTPLAHNR